MTDHVLDQLARSDVPAHLRDGLVGFLTRGYLPGHFLTAVLSNNLTEAINRADDDSFAGLPAIVRFLVNHAPREAWGDAARVRAWKGIGR